MFKKFIESMIKEALEKDFEQIAGKVNKINYDKILSTEMRLYFTVETIWEDKTISGYVDYQGVMFFRDLDYVFCLHNGFSHIM